MAMNQSASDRAELAPAALLFHSLSDPVRLAIVQRLAVGEARVADLTSELGLAQSTVSKHLACLRDCGLVDFRPEGRQSFYHFDRPELLDLLRSAERLLAATGDAVVLCPVYGPSATETPVTDEGKPTTPPPDDDTPRATTEDA
ncbi:transcriptional regulator [Nocardiopsis gilva YIM 90087]|uniref:Transcriptional regulator n=1 Tax=Nocardiopsis gilva YIM 90087 TaxID=1235441 RepID=A0A223S773_9ACTN|nr:transcriptional regulator [Nocardiopsis gilva YIM 90087]